MQEVDQASSFIRVRGREIRRSSSGKLSGAVILADPYWADLSLALAQLVYLRQLSAQEPTIWSTLAKTGALTWS